MPVTIKLRDSNSIFMMNLELNISEKTYIYPASENHTEILGEFMSRGSSFSNFPFFIGKKDLLG